MRKNKWLILAISFSFFLVLASQMAFAETEQITDTIQISDAELQTSSSFGPGSSYPLFCPDTLFEGYVYVSGLEPTSITWTVYTPNFVEVTKLTHPPSIKGNTDDGKWYFGDKTAFVIPAFAEKGMWAASCEVTFSDGSKGSLSFGDGQYMYEGIAVGNSGSIVTNLFSAPWYFFGAQMPPVFWFPLILLWGPAIFIGICYISPQIAETFRRGLARLQEARKK